MNRSLPRFLSLRRRKRRRRPSSVRLLKKIAKLVPSIFRPADFLHFRPGVDTPRYSFANAVGGLAVRDIRTGELIWSSLGTAPRGCIGVTLSNGRVYWPGAANGMIYCWESGQEQSEGSSR